MKIAVSGVLALAGALSGCFSIGPPALERDSFSYSTSLAETWRRQMLLNMVRMRYAETPVFLEVASLITQYSLEGQVGVNSPGWDRPNSVGPPVGSVAGRWTDRPTITYTPLSGERFTRSLLTPLPPHALASLLQSGWPVEYVFGVTVRSINGIAGGTRAQFLREDPDLRYQELLQHLSEIQRSNAIDMRIVRKAEGDTVVMVLDRPGAEKVAEARQRVREILGLPADAKEFSLVYGTLPQKPEEIAILSRSLLEIMGEFCFGIEVPAAHVAEGRVAASPDFGGTWIPPTVRIHSSEERPPDAAVAVQHRDHWFWIDDRDLLSKRNFSLLLLLISLAESGSKSPAPLITVGAG